MSDQNWKAKYGMLRRMFLALQDLVCDLEDRIKALEDENKQNYQSNHDLITEAIDYKEEASASRLYAYSLHDKLEAIRKISQKWAITAHPAAYVGARNILDIIDGDDAQP